MARNRKRKAKKPTSISYSSSMTTTTTSSSSSSSSRTATNTNLPESPLDSFYDTVPLSFLLDFNADDPEEMYMKAALSRRRRLIIVNDRDVLVSVQDNFFYSEHKMLLHMVEKEKEEEGQVSSRKFVEKLEGSLDRHAFFSHSRPLPMTILNQMISFLPNLTVFQMMQQDASSQDLEKVILLLDHFHHQLEEVTIWFWGERDEQNLAEQQLSFQRVFTSLMTSLNSMTKLRSLEVTFRSAPGCSVVIADDQLVQHSLPDVVGKLETLKFRTRLESNNFNGRDNPIPDSRLLKQILVGMRDGRASADQPEQQPQPKKHENVKLYVSKTPLTLRSIISLGPGLVAAGLRSVEIDGYFSGNSKAEYKALAQLARQSPHLQELVVNLKCFSIWRLVESLSSLKELVHLNINCDADKPFLEAEVNVHRLPVLSNVKSLRLGLTAPSHREYEHLHLATLFPNLQTVEWAYFGWRCTDCGYEIPKKVFTQGNLATELFKATYGRQMQDCLRLARLAAFSRLTRLANLWVRVFPHRYPLPFKDQVFTSRRSLYGQTQFTDLHVEEEDFDNCVLQ